MAYPGGKAGAGVYQAVINQIPPHDAYIEPFLGGGAVMLRKLPARRNVGVEVDREVAERFQVLAAGFSGQDLQVYCCDGVEWLRHAFGLHLVPPPDRPSTAAAGGYDGAAGRVNGSCVGGSRSGGPPNGATVATAAISGDGRSTAFVYCDPPYLLSTRRSRRRIYRHEMDEEGHARLLDTVCRLPCPVAVSGYASSLYQAALESWRCIRFPAVTRGGPAEECLWMNYAPPASLHDYRYLGNGKRERERIARKARTWAAGLKRLGPLERQAVISAILAGTGSHPSNP